MKKVVEIMNSASAIDRMPGGRQPPALTFCLFRYSADSSSPAAAYGTATYSAFIVKDSSAAMYNP